MGNFSPPSIEQRKPRRRWFQFSLRTLLILITLFSFVAAWIGNWVYESEHQKRVVADLRSRPGISVAYNDKEVNDRPAVPSWAPQSLIDKLGIDYFYNADAILIDEQQANIRPSLDKALELPYVSLLSIRPRDYFFELENWESIGRMKNLEYLFLSYNFSDVALEKQHLKQLSKMRVLRLITDKPHFDSIAELASLEQLYLTTYGVDLSEVEKLKALKNLKKLAYAEYGSSYKPVDTEKVAIIAQSFPKLEKLASGRTIKLEDMKMFQNHPTLTFILFEEVPAADVPKIGIHLWKQGDQF